MNTEESLNLYSQKISQPEKLNQNDPWYYDDQFAIQLGTVSRRRIIENRWEIFEDAIKKHFRQNSGNVLKILDAGCGDGINLFGFSQICKRNSWNFELTGVDYNPIRIERAENIRNITALKQCSLLDLPFDAETFDVVLCNHVLEHILEDDKALTELHRVIKNDAILILGVPNEGCTLAWLRNHVLQRNILKTTDHINFYTKSSLTKKLLSNKFKCITFVTEGFFTPYLPLHSYITERSWGNFVFSKLRKLFPSQSAGLFAICEKML